MDYTDLKVEEKYVKVFCDTVTCIEEGTVSVEFYCKVCVEKVSVITSIKVNVFGQLAEYTVLVMYNGGWFYVSNGILNIEINGLVPYVQR